MVAVLIAAAMVSLAWASTVCVGGKLVASGLVGVSREPVGVGWLG